MVGILVFVVVIFRAVRGTEAVDCSSYCSPAQNNETQSCNVTSGECLFGCLDGYHGPSCQELCTDNVTGCAVCSANSQQFCTECMNNFYHQTDDECASCPYFCLAKPGDVCRQTDGYCSFGCKNGHYGDKCGTSCKQTCVNTTCDRDTGHCTEGCKSPSYCGTTCEVTCSETCRRSECNQSCLCADGCTQQYWKADCTEVCNERCNQPPDSTNNTCNKDDGTCLYGCANSSYWGIQCAEPCSQNCINGLCQQVSGNCTDGCTTNTVCGGTCNDECNGNCRNGTCEGEDWDSGSQQTHDVGKTLVISCFMIVMSLLQR